MQHDVVGLRDFYNRPLGGIVRRLLTQRIRTRWRNAMDVVTRNDVKAWWNSFTTRLRESPARAAA